jgi:uncharacterized protein (TIGR01777 family)
MKVVIPGGTGQLGQVLVRGLRARGHQVEVIGRRVEQASHRWDGRTMGAWCELIEGADAVINLAGRSVNCRYHWANLNEMMRSRVDSAQVVGQAIAAASKPPKVWLQASTASIYAHTLDEPHDEARGELGGREAHVPDYWSYSVSIARAWELALAAADTPHTRKVALRTGFVMSPDRGGIFDQLMWMIGWRLSGPFCGGDQYVSWLDGEDLVGIVDFLLHEASLEGPVNLTAPVPMQNRAFMAVLREAAGSGWGLPINYAMAHIGAAWLKTDVELMLKSRRVVPRKLLDAGYVFTSSRWEDAAPRLVERWREGV